MKDALMILLLHTGEPLQFEVPLEVCLAQHRRWRYVDAIGGSITATREGVKLYVREIRCEERNEGPPAA